MIITIRHRCGRATEWWAPDCGGYVRRVSERRPGALGWQPLIGGGHTLTCGPGEEALRAAVRRYSRYVGRHSDGQTCACGGYLGHDVPRGSAS